VRKEFCVDNFLSIQTLEMIDDLRRQVGPFSPLFPATSTPRLLPTHFPPSGFLTQYAHLLPYLFSQFRQQLVEIGFASRGPPPPPEELYKVDVALLQCVLTCGLYPQVGASIHIIDILCCHLHAFIVIASWTE
jgi:hypothetical protein